MERNRIKMISIVQGLLVILAGVLLYLFNVGTLPVEYKPIVFSWQMLLIAVGFSCLFSYRGWGFGLITILVGGYFLLQKMDIESLKFITNNGWSIILIILGFIILWHAIMGHGKFHRNRHIEYKGKRTGKQSYNSTGTGYIQRDLIFSGANEKMDVPDFKGGEINCVFGGIELDLMDCMLAEGVNTLEINTVFGGTVIYAPIEWNIQIHQSSILGQFSDNRPKPDFIIDDSKVLIIKASSIFGGGEIKCKKH